MQRVRWVVLVVVLQGGVVACGEEEQEPINPGECFDYSGWDGSLPTVSLRGRLLNNGVGAQGGLLRRACGVSTCHGSQTRPDGQVFIGPPLGVSITDAQRALVLTNLLDARSATNPEVMRVAPRDPANSFLMRKVDGCFEGIQTGCSPLAEAESKNPCGDRMPQDNPPLDASERDEIRRWIAQGAMDDP